MEAACEQLEARLGYHFQDSKLLQRALTHRSHLEGKAGTGPELSDNEQLEFLGDAILGFVVSEALVRRNEHADEGQLSRWKSHLVSATHLHQCAIQLDLGAYLRLGRGEDRNGGRERKSLLADAVEALIAALFLDGGLSAAKQFIEQNLLDVDSDIEELSLSNNQKIDLQTKARTMGFPSPVYRIVSEEGPDHAKEFIAEVRLGDKLFSRGRATTKRMAALVAAREMLTMLDEETRAAKTSEA